MAIEKPRTMKETVDAIWYALFGFNSGDGVIRDVANVKSDVAEIKAKVPTFETLDDHRRFHAAYVASIQQEKKEEEDHGDRRKVSLREWWGIGLATLMGLGLIAVSLLEFFASRAPK